MKQIKISLIKAIRGDDDGRHFFQNAYQKMGDVITMKRNWSTAFEALNFRSTSKFEYLAITNGVFGFLSYLRYHPTANEFFDKVWQEVGVATKR